MGIFDDPLDAALERVESDARADDDFLGIANKYKKTTTKLVQGIVGLVAHPNPIVASAVLKEVLSAWRDDSSQLTAKNQAYILSAVIEKLKLIDSAALDDRMRIDRLENVLGQTIAYVGPITTKDRLQAFASIAVSGSMIYVNDPLEQTDEFLRITSVLTSTDIQVLIVLNKAQRSISTYEEPAEPIGYENDYSETMNHSQLLNAHRTKLYGAWKSVEHEVRSNSISETSFRSALVRLQALGLVEPIVGGFDAGKPGYEVLELGRLYLDYISDHHDSGEQSEA